MSEFFFFKYFATFDIMNQGRKTKVNSLQGKFHDLMDWKIDDSKCILGGG